MFIDATSNLVNCITDAFIAECYIWTEDFLIEVDAIEYEELQQGSPNKIVNASLSYDHQNDMLWCVPPELILSLVVHGPHQANIRPPMQLTQHEVCQEFC